MSVFNCWSLPLSLDITSQSIYCSLLPELSYNHIAGIVSKGELLFYCNFPKKRGKACFLPLLIYPRYPERVSRAGEPGPPAQVVDRVPEPGPGPGGEERVLLQPEPAYPHPGGQQRGRGGGRGGPEPSSSADAASHHRSLDVARQLALVLALTTHFSGGWGVVGQAQRRERGISIRIIVL